MGIHRTCAALPGGCDLQRAEDRLVVWLPTRRDMVRDFFDNARRNLHVGPVITPTGDLDTDLARILQLYAERLGTPRLPQSEVPAS